MTDPGPTPSGDLPAPPSPGKSRLKHILGFITGVVLVGIAVIVIATGSSSIPRALDELKSPDPVALTLILLLPVANVVTTALAFLVLIRPVGRVTFFEMNALIAGAWFLNYLPLRPGMVGRIAYHKKVNAIPVGTSIHITCIEAMLGFPSAAIVLALCLPLIDTRAPLWLWGVLVLTFIGGLGASLVWARIAKLPLAPVIWAMLVRVADHAVWSLRIWAGFTLLGCQIDAATATTIGLVGQLSLMVPVTGNGLGVREWAAAVTAETLVAAGAVAAMQDATAKELTLAATLLVRVGELLACAPLGLAASAWVSRHAIRAIASDNPPRKTGN